MKSTCTFLKVSEMAAIKVKLIATLGRLAGRDVIEISVDGDGLTVRDVLSKLHEVSSDELMERLFKQGSMELQSDILVLVNDVEISALDGLDTVVRDGDTVVLLPTVHGG